MVLLASSECDLEHALENPLELFPEAMENCETLDKREMLPSKDVKISWDLIHK